MSSSAPGSKLSRTTKLTIRSAEEQVYEALRDDIVRGAVPDAPLRLLDLAERLGVSTMPVRAALRRLEAEGLVRHSPRRGTMPAPLDINDLEEIQAIRSGLEGYAARLAAETVTPRDLKDMRNLLGRMRLAREQGKMDTYLGLERAFYMTAYRASGRVRLIQLVETFHRAAERYIRVASVADPDLSDSIQFPEQFHEACEAHDGVRAEQVLRRGLEWTVLKLRPLLADAGPSPGTVASLGTGRGRT